MKKVLMVTLAMVMALTLVFGSVATASAAVPVKTPSMDFTITSADVITQTIYYTVSWKNLPQEMAVGSFIANFYYPDNEFEVNDILIAQSSKVFNKAKTSYSSHEMSAVVSIPSYSFKSGDYIQGRLYLLDAADNTIFPDPCYFNYLVP